MFSLDRRQECGLGGPAQYGLRLPGDSSSRKTDVSGGGDEATEGSHTTAGLEMASCAQRTAGRSVRRGVRRQRLLTPRGRALFCTCQPNRWTPAPKRQLGESFPIQVPSALQASEGRPATETEKPTPSCSHPPRLWG